jgi:two-component system, NtrC family, nitrogen regulation response regulator GlnG
LATRAGKILVVDDEPEVRLVLTEFLESQGYEVTAAASGAEALAMVDAAKPHVVLLDVTMPEMDGMETLKRLAAAHPGLPIIMVTANADVDITSRLLALGAADYIPKPFDLDYLGQAVGIQVSAALDP